MRHMDIFKVSFLMNTHLMIQVNKNEIIQLNYEITQTDDNN